MNDQCSSLCLLPTCCWLGLQSPTWSAGIECSRWLLHMGLGRGGGEGELSRDSQDSVLSMEARSFSTRLTLQQGSHIPYMAVSRTAKGRSCWAFLGLRPRTGAVALHCTLAQNKSRDSPDWIGRDYPGHREEGCNSQGSSLDSSRHAQFAKKEKKMQREKGDAIGYILNAG